VCTLPGWFREQNQHFTILGQFFMLPGVLGKNSGSVGLYNFYCIPTQCNISTHLIPPGNQSFVGFKLPSAFSCSGLLLMSLLSEAIPLSGHHTTASEFSVGLWRPINHFTGQHITRLLTFLNHLHYNCFLMWKKLLR